MGKDGEGEAQLRHVPKRGLNRTRGFSFGYFSLFQDFNLWKPVGQYDYRTHDEATEEAESYITPRNSQVDYDSK